MDWATSSFPVPVSPYMRTLESVMAIFSIWDFIFIISGSEVIMSSSRYFVLFFDTLNGPHDSGFLRYYLFIKKPGKSYRSYQIFAVIHRIRFSGLRQADPPFCSYSAFKVLCSNTMSGGQKRRICVVNINKNIFDIFSPDRLESDAKNL